MPSSVAHAAVAVIANQILHRSDRTRTTVLAAALVAAAPDLDSVGWLLHGSDGPLPEDHRGISHSLAIAISAAMLMTVIRHWQRPVQSMARVFLYFALVIISHGLLDAFSSYGTGVALLAPYENRRFRTSWSLFDGPFSEIIYLWLPAVIFIRWNIGGFFRSTGSTAAKQQGIEFL